MTFGNKAPEKIPFTGEPDRTPMGPRIGAEPLEPITPETAALGRFTITALLAVGLLTALAGLAAGMVASPSAANLVAEASLLVSVIPVVVTVVALWTRDPVGIIGSRGLMLITIIVGLTRPGMALVTGAIGRLAVDINAGIVPWHDLFSVGVDGIFLAALAALALLTSKEMMPGGRETTLFERTAASLLVASHSVSLVAGWLAYAAIGLN